MAKHTPRQIALRSLIKVKQDCDPESGHIDADKVLCDLLITLGYQDVVDSYNAIQKWYA